MQGSGFRVQGSGFRVQGAGFRVQGSGCRVQGSGCRVQGAGCRDLALLDGGLEGALVDHRGRHEREGRHPVPAFQIREMCSASEAGSYLRLIDFVYHSTLGLRVIKKTIAGR